MSPAIRVAAALLTAVGTYYFTYWAGGALLVSLDAPAWIAFLTAVVAAALVTWLVWTHSAPSSSGGAFRSIFIGAVVTGAIGFCAGFFGPLVLTPDANQGPLLGIFITGPLGFLLGGVGGGIHWLVRRQRKLS